MHKNNEIFSSVNTWVSDTLEENIIYENTEYITGKPKKLSDIEMIYERVHLELKYYIHIEKTKSLLNNTPLFLNCLDFISYLLRKIKIEKESFTNITIINKKWGNITSLFQ
jgi:hypothetical protein